MAAFAARYARALADVVQGAGLKPEEVKQQVEDFVATFAGSKDLREASPQSPRFRSGSGCRSWTR